MQNYLANEFARKHTAIKGLQMFVVSTWTQFRQIPGSTLRNCFLFKIKNELVKTVHTSSAVFINMALAMSLRLLVFSTANNMTHSVSFIIRPSDAVFTSFLCYIPLAALGEMESRTIKVTHF